MSSRGPSSRLNPRRPLSGSATRRLPHRLAPAQAQSYIAPMLDLRDRLQSALGDSYRIERELGGGGMSRVFLAEEVRLGRQVVVKVLPPELAAGVSADRFEREIRLAAALQHPHIVPLLTAGSRGDLLYYVMPHIAGESLRARIAHERELPVGDTVRILRDVCDALAYAHGHGIVHRDVKPDNVLLSGKHALVTDFGVAKAVASSSGAGGGTLTSLGMALGTPAYMAPEQAAGDPTVDHRADLYAVGALGYELLTGRTPFGGLSPQGMLAAQVTTTPDPVTQHRDTVPPALAALIMRCLAKHPADRPQSAEELLGQLEGMATPTGATTPEQAPISSGTAAAIRRAHPVRVATLFGFAALGVLTLAYLLVHALGLPDWAFAGAVGLAAAGLPIMLWTGVIERRRALAGSLARSGPGPRARPARGREGGGARPDRSAGPRVRGFRRAGLRRGRRRARLPARDGPGRRGDHRGGGSAVGQVARAHRGVAQDDPRERPAGAGDDSVARGAAEILTGRAGERRGRYGPGRGAVGRSDRPGHHVRHGVPQARRGVEQLGRRGVAHRRGRDSSLPPPRPAHPVRARLGRGVLLHAGRVRSRQDRSGVPCGVGAAAGERRGAQQPGATVQRAAEIR